MRFSTTDQTLNLPKDAYEKIGCVKIFTDTISGSTTEKLVFHIFGALAEFERDIIEERTKAGLQAARSRGKLGGRPKAKTLNTSKKVAMAQLVYDDKSNTIDEICKTLCISRSTLYRYIQTPQVSKVKE